METPQKKPMLPNAVAVFVLGLCSLAVPCAGLITGIVGWVLSGTGMRIYRDNPTVWEGYSLLQAGRILSIIGTILHSVWMLLVVVVLIFAIAYPTMMAVWTARLPWWLID